MENNKKKLKETSKLDSNILYHDDIGEYKTGCFYSNSFSGEPYETDLIYPNGGIGREDYNSNQFGIIVGGEKRTLRLITLLHETSHYVHDLSLGTCIEFDHQKDKIYFFLRIALQKLTQKSAVRCPLMSEENSNQWSTDLELKKIFEGIKSLQLFINNLRGKPNNFVEDCAKLSPIFFGEKQRLQTLSGNALLEGLVATKTLLALSERIRNREDVEYLETYKENLAILPEKLDQIYNAARKFFDWTIGLNLLHINPNYVYDQWPRDYHQSQRFLGDTAFIYLADIALHIPPSAFISQRLEKGQNDPRDFIPTYRFCKAILSIIRRGRFPDGSPENFYRILYDSFAKDSSLCWPTLEETNNAWKVILSLAKKNRREASDGYRYRMLVERNLHPHAIVMMNPLMACFRQFVPIVHLTPDSFKVFNAIMTEDRFYAWPYELPSQKDNHGFFKKDCGFWQDNKFAFGESQKFGDIETANSQLLIQEQIYRSICREFQKAVLYSQYLSCPFAQLGCSVAMLGCGKISNLGDIPKSRCCLREWLLQDHLDPAKIKWS